MEKTLIGAVQVNKPFIYIKNDYECAAWREEHEAIPGVYPVYVESQYHFPHHLGICAKIDAVVTSDYFPVLFGGVAVSKLYESKHLGEKRVIHKSIDVLEAIERTGNSPGEDLDWYIDPECWRFFVEEAAIELKKEVARIPSAWEDFLSEEDILTTNYQRKAGSLGYIGTNITKWSRRLEKISWYLQYYSKEYNKKTFRKNTEWAKGIK